MNYPLSTVFTLPPTNCSIYLAPSHPTFYLSLAITVGIVISYIPQYQNIYNTKSSYGLAPTFLLLNNISGFSATGNLILLSFISLPCCLQLSFFECINSQISLIQVGVQTISTFGITVCCLLFTDIQDPIEKDGYLEILKVFKAIVGFIIGLVFSLTFSYFYDNADWIYSLAKFLGMFSTITTILQYLPQLYTTYKLKRSGVLSIKMMLIQFPGGLLWSLTLILKPGSHWSSWLPYLSAALIQGVLLMLNIYYDYYYTGIRGDEEEALLRYDDNRNRY